LAAGREGEEGRDREKKGRREKRIAVW